MNCPRCETHVGKKHDIETIRLDTSNEVCPHCGALYLNSKPNGSVINPPSRRSQTSYQNNFNSFDQARKYVLETGRDWDLLEFAMSVYAVLHHGKIVGKGQHWNTAIADAESNIGSLIHDQKIVKFSLDLT